MWEYAIVALILGWAVYSVWKIFVRAGKGGCGCAGGCGKKKEDGECCGQHTLHPMPKEDAPGRDS